MTWFTRKPKATQESYLQAGTTIVAHLFNRLGRPGLGPEGQTYTPEETKAISDFLNAFVAWGKQQAPPLFAVNADGQIFFILSLALLRCRVTLRQLLFKNFIEAVRTKAGAHKKSWRPLCEHGFRSWILVCCVT
jgi:hypothetical protein